jgi:hypothetical protein
MICDDSPEYNEFIKYLNHQGIKSSGEDEIRVCVFYCKITDKNDSSTGFYSLRSSWIHSPYFLYVQYANNRRHYLKKYDLDNFIAFVSKHYPKVHPDESECENLNHLMSFWCEKLNVRE